MMTRATAVLLATAVVVSVLLASTAYAQAGGDPVATQGGYLNPHAAVLWGQQRTAPEPTAAPSESIQSLVFPGHSIGVVSNRRPVPAFQPSSGNRRRSVGRKVAGGVIGAVGGFFGGGFLGAAIEGDRCDCDDPGLVGFVIGAPVGAVIGGIVGFKFF